MAFLEKAKKQDLVLLAEELGQKVSDKMTIIDLKNIIIGSKDYEEEFVRAQLSVISEERVERETEEKIARQHAIQQLRWESELNELRSEIESIRSNVKRTSCAEDRKKTSSNYRISIGRAGEHMRETSPAVLMAEATIPVTTPIKEENGMDDLRVVYVKVKGEQEMVNAVMDTGAQMLMVRPDVVEGQSIGNRGSIQITSAFGEREMGEVKDSNMELNDLRHGVVPVSKNLVNDMLICSSDYEGLIENSQMVRNPAILRELSGEEGIINSVNSESVCSQEVVTDLLPETYTQSLMNIPNGDLVAVRINGSNVRTNGQGIKESKIEVAFTCVFKNRILYSDRRGRLLKSISSEPTPLPPDRVTDCVHFEIVGIDLAGPLYVKDGRKVWIKKTLFTCAVYRAIHLELVNSLTSDAFLLALRCFIARRGRPRTIYCDNGTNFRGAFNDLSKLNWSKIVEETRTPKILWKFISPTAAWWGGWWKRLVRTVKELF
ncbi:integrase catalytic domain-containing protein [Trichonephila clavipes]|nr:integrase catalytic domain-containing protein [Trichonephila clavipes]